MAILYSLKHLGNAIMVRSNWYLPIWSNFLINFVCKKNWLEFSSHKTFDKNYFFFSQIESYHEIFDRTEKLFDLNGQICPDL